jgi:hypothetical protein
MSCTEDNDDIVLYSSDDEAAEVVGDGAMSVREGDEGKGENGNEEKWIEWVPDAPPSQWFDDPIRGAAFEEAFKQVRMGLK